MSRTHKTRNKQKTRRSKRRQAGVTPHPLTELQMGYFQTVQGKADLAEAKAYGDERCLVHFRAAAEAEELLREGHVSIERLVTPDEEGGWSIDEAPHGMDGWRVCRRNLRTQNGSSEFVVLCEGLCNQYSVDGVGVLDMELTRVTVIRGGTKTMEEPAHA